MYDSDEAFAFFEKKIAFIPKGISTKAISTNDPTLRRLFWSMPKEFWPAVFIQAPLSWVA